MSNNADIVDQAGNKLCLGALSDLTKKVKTHLFLICPNNSGSTYIKGVMANSKYTWNLAREGQHMLGFQGVSTSQIGAELLWATDKWLKYFTDDSLFNWPQTKKAWYFTATSSSEDAPVFFSKSPPSIVWVDSLKQHFENTKFIFMVRNPYAVVEGIARRKKARFGREEILRLASEHIMKCFELQINNIQMYPDSVFFTYEFLCDYPERVKEKLESFLPELSDLDFAAEIPVKGNYCEPLRNMNEQQIKRLSSSDLAVMNRVFDCNPEYLEYFGYKRNS